MWFLIGSGTLARAAAAAGSVWPSCLRRLATNTGILQQLGASNLPHDHPSVASAAYSSSDMSLSYSPTLEEARLQSTGLTSSAVLGDIKPDLVDKFLSLEMLSQGRQLTAKRQQVIKQFQRHPGDVGSPEVTVAVWTHRIRELVMHFKVHRKHVHKMRRLEWYMNHRRRLLIYLRRANFEAYAYVISKLGLKDLYTDTRREDRYRVGMRHGDPTDDRVRRRRFMFHTKYKVKKTNMWRRLKPAIIEADPAAPVH